MKKWIYILILFILFTIKNSMAQLPPSDPAWQLKFSDDFTVTALDTSKWAQIPEWNQYGTSDSSGCAGSPYDKAYKKWYRGITLHQPDTTDCKISGGTAKLYTRKENYIGKVWHWPGGAFREDSLLYKYTSGMLVSKYKFRYGYFEIKFRLPATLTSPATYDGFGPNFWLFGSDVNANWSEIDVFEIKSQNNLYTTNTHYQRTGTDPNHYQETGFHGNLNANQWYTAAVNWSPDSVEFYLDGVKIRQYNAEDRADSLRPMSIFIDINSPATNFCSNFDTVHTTFPYTYEIDYVKVYQKQMACDTPKLYCNVNAAGYTSKLYQSLTIGGTGCTANISTANTSCLGVNYVLLNEGFSVDGSTNAYIDVLSCETQNFYRATFPVTTPAAPSSAFTQRMYYKSTHQQ